MKTVKTARHRRGEVFWSWWIANSQKLKDPHSAHGPELDDAVALLQKYDDALGLEFANAPDGKLKVVVTAYGDRDHRRAVEDLFRLKPEIPGIGFVAFKPAATEDFNFELEGFQLSTEKMRFSSLRSEMHPEILGIKVFFESGCQIPQRARFTGALIVAITMLGEQAYMDSISLLQVGERAEPEFSKLIPIVELPNFIEWRSKRGRKDA